jgi:hypothetical protein
MGDNQVDSGEVWDLIGSSLVKSRPDYSPPLQQRRGLFYGARLLAAFDRGSVAAAPQALWRLVDVPVDVVERLRGHPGLFPGCGSARTHDSGRTRMQIHGRAKLGPAGWLVLRQAIEDGATFRQATAMLSVSPATAHRRWHRYRVASLAKRHSLAWAVDRWESSAPLPGLLDARAEERIGEARRQTGWGRG